MPWRVPPPVPRTRLMLAWACPARARCPGTLPPSSPGPSLARRSPRLGSPPRAGGTRSGRWPIRERRIRTPGSNTGVRPFVVTAASNGSDASDGAASKHASTTVTALSPSSSSSAARPTSPAKTTEPTDCRSPANAARSALARRRPSGTRTSVSLGPVCPLGERLDHVPIRRPIAQEHLPVPLVPRGDSDHPEGPGTGRSHVSGLSAPQYHPDRGGGGAGSARTRRRSHRRWPRAR
jgi:hypothetical protein